MTGLYENISELGKNKSLTFFVHTPKIILDPLSLAAIAFPTTVCSEQTKKNRQTMQS